MVSFEDGTGLPQIPKRQAKAATSEADAAKRSLTPNPEPKP